MADAATPSLQAWWSSSSGRLKTLSGLGVGLAVWRACACARAVGSSSGGGDESRSSPQHTFYVSPHEISRIPNLVKEAFSQQLRALSAEEIAAGATADFVWLHKATKTTEALRECASVCSLLSGFEVMEDKRNLALLQQRMEVPTLQSYVCESPAKLTEWCRRQFEDAGGAAGGMWMVKDAGGNGGDGLWVLTSENWRETAAEVEQHSNNTHSSADPIVYVVQKYVERPLLWPDGCKFHFRCYCVLTATMDFYIYRDAFAHVANKPFRTAYDPGESGGAVRGNGFDKEVHITNCSQNIHDASQFHRYPQVNLPRDYPVVWENMKRLFADLARCAAPFMANQLNRNHFCHIGADIIADEDGTPWLIEANCPPNLFAYTNDPDHPDEKAITPLIRAMLSDLMRLFVLPVVSSGSTAVDAGQWEHVPAAMASQGSTEDKSKPWEASSRKALAMNALAFASYKRRLRKSKDNIFV